MKNFLVFINELKFGNFKNIKQILITKNSIKIKILFALLFCNNFYSFLFYTYNSTNLSIIFSNLFSKTFWYLIGLKHYLL